MNGSLEVESGLNVLDELHTGEQESSQGPKMEINKSSEQNKFLTANHLIVPSGIKNSSK